MFKNIVFTFVTINSWFFANAQTASGIEEETNIYERIYNAPIRVSRNQQLTFTDLNNKKPLLLALIFTKCAGVCNPFLLQLKENLQFINSDNPFTILVLSFDPRDRLGDMNLLAQKLGLENNKKWIFAVTDSIALLNQSIGFYPRWDSVRSQYDHDALLVGINKEGYITKKLIGIRDKLDLDLLISSVNNIYSPTYRLPNKNILFSCFNYDPKTGKNRPGLGWLFIALPAVLAMSLLLSISFIVHNKLPAE